MGEVAGQADQRCVWVAVAAALGLAAGLLLGAATPLKAERSEAPATLSLAAPESAAAQASSEPAVPALPEAGFVAYLNGLWPKARAAGIGAETFKRALTGLTPDPVVLSKLDRQPESEQPIWVYLEQIVSEKRTRLGFEALEAQRGLLDAIEATYGVPREIVVAVWGIESLYGTNTGSYNVIRSLATLGWKGGRRAAFGQQQLLAALKIVEHHDIEPDGMTGSWAGAMGHTQFIPTTFNAFAVDFDRDGRRDIWHSVPDALASAARYLADHKWRPGEPWGIEVVLPEGFDFAQSGLATQRPLSAWARLGVRRADGKPFRRGDLKASVLLPAGARGPALLVFANFRVIMRYNHAVAYGLAVGTLADRFKGEPALAGAWPTDERPLQRQEREELQRRLAAAGYGLTSLDGVIGSETIKALRAFQQRKGLPADGHPSLRVLEALRNES